METSNSDFSLKGKKVVILGGSSGLGLATAQAAAAEGANVVIVSSNAARVQNAVAQLPGNAFGMQADLSDESSIQRLFEEIGTLDHLVFTAGESLLLSKIADTEVAMARAFFDLRYWGAFMAVKYAAPRINAGGSIVLTGGIVSARPNAGWSIGASICAAMDGFTRAMAVELAPVRVNLVSPGVIRTNLWSSMAETERDAFYDQVAEALPVRHLGEAEQVAQTYLYLMKQPFVTGQILVTDGGAVLV
ncbi:NAD(P)-dependent dehydrogenase, short-chain alcohol dehydrogenase family [Dyadobacter soli]|uniref:NAD(P)-dependent dehydrogenase, short-chain alcohol dehydrogenase family n=1 Tax=Dyadobacter soli TaxID=659014 RepID=A0A1G6X160_9BACT|nr:SDR family oxidoreductase [Dyadobacter soli]SDD71147.1 NAD(P)-dependent dehydrogenase, short-chain alcohol dehydrogenase family [Dyadobacter soli]